MRIYTFFLALSCLLAGCGPSPDAVASDPNGDSVKVQIAASNDPDEARRLSLAAAQRVCAKRSRRAEYTATRTVADNILENLYLCR